jgi:hypothetical protein
VWRASAKSSCGGSRGESVELLSRELGVLIFKLEQWRQKADAALDSALKDARRMPPASNSTPP